MELLVTTAMIAFFLLHAGVEIITGPVARGFAVGPVKSAIHWPGWPVKF